MNDSYKVYASQEYVDNKIKESRVQPDWNQNDPTALDYVKNRTHYSETVETPICTAQEFSFTVNIFDRFAGACAEYLGTESEKSAPYPLHGYQDDLSNPDLVQKIVFDGVEYTCAPFNVYTGWTGYGYGNASLLSSGSADTGEPFCWCYFPETASNGQYVKNAVYFITNETADTAVEHTISAYSTTQTELVETVKKLDSKYLPDGVPYSEVIGMNILADNVNVETSGGWSHENALQLSGLVAGEDLLITVDGVEYTLKIVDCSSISGWVNWYCIGNLSIEGSDIGELDGSDTTVPFVIEYHTSGNETWFYHQEDGLHTVSVQTKKVEYHKIDVNCLPDISIPTYDLMLLSLDSFASMTSSSIYITHGDYNSVLKKALAGEAINIGLLCDCINEDDGNRRILVYSTSKVDFMNPVKSSQYQQSRIFAYFTDGVVSKRIWIEEDSTISIVNDEGLNGIASEEYVDTKISELVNAAPEALDTLNELSAALGNDPNFATTVLTQLGNKADTAALEGLATESYVDHKISALGGRPILNDSVTGTNYMLYVENGKLTMQETEVLGGTAIFKDAATGQNYELYVVNGELTMKEAE